MTLKQKWAKAQKGERKTNEPVDFHDGEERFGHAYGLYFKYTKVNQNLKGKRIIEIGCSNYPALHYCHNYGTSYIIEPLVSTHLLKYLQHSSIALYPCAAEDVNFPVVDEVWLFNVLQHTMNPDLIIAKSKAAADIIRFFEPIEYGTDGMHLHDFTMEYFTKHFGKCATYYPANQEIERFHAHQSAYGIYNHEIL